MKKVLLIIVLLLSTSLFACGENNNLEEIIATHELEMFKGIGYDKALVLEKLGYDVDTILSIHNERHSTWTSEDPEVLLINGSIFQPMKAGTTNVIVEGINTKITIKVTVDELDYFDGTNIYVNVGQVINVEELIKSFSLKVKNITFEPGKVYYKDYQLLGLNKGESKLNVTFDGSDFIEDVDITIPIKVDFGYDYLDLHINIINQIYSDIHDYRDFEPVVTFTKEYIYKIAKEQKEEEITKIYNEFTVKYNELIEELNKDYAKYAEEFIKDFEEYFGQYKTLDERVSERIEGLKISLNSVCSSLEEVIVENRSCIESTRGLICLKEEYYENEKTNVINKINAYYEEHKDCEGSFEIKERWIKQISEAKNENSVEAIWLYDIEFINEIEKNHYKNLNKAAIKEKYFSYMANRYEQYVVIENVENIQEVFYKYFDKLLEVNASKDVMVIYNEFETEVTNAYYNSEKYLSGYKQEIKNNIETTYEEFCTWYPDLTNEYVKVRNFIDEYISKIEAATDCETVDSLHNEYQEKFYDFVNNLFQ